MRKQTSMYPPMKSHDKRALSIGMDVWFVPTYLSAQPSRVKIIKLEHSRRRVLLQWESGAEQWVSMKTYSWRPSRIFVSAAAVRKQLVKVGLLQVESVMLSLSDKKQRLTEVKKELRKARSWKA